MTYTVALTDIQEYNTHHFTINPRRAALLVIEMQNIFLKEFNIITERQMDNIQSIITAGEKAGIKIIYVRHNDNSELSKPMIEWWGGGNVDKGTDGWQIMDRFDTAGKTIIDKNQYSAFFKTDLDEILKAAQIEDVIITGVMTNCCCETAARDAFMRGYRVFFINDATTTINEELHLATLKNLAFGFACVQNTQDLIADIKEVL